MMIIKTHNLSPNQVHLWRLNTQHFLHYVPFFRPFLSFDEIEKSSFFSLPLLGDRYIINRYYLRAILGEYLNIKPHEIKFTYGKKGKPELDNIIDDSPIKFNLSHKEEYTIFAFSQCLIGVDLEIVTDKKIDYLAIAKRFFCPKEYEFLITVNQEIKYQYFLQMWTAKEAYLKAIGEGLSGGLNSFCLRAKNNNNITIDWLLNDNKSNNKPPSWQIKTINLEDNKITSIALNSMANYTVEFKTIS